MDAVHLRDRGILGASDAEVLDRRVLFLVDRSALREQTENTYKEMRLEQQQLFTDIFDLKGLGDIKPDRDTRVHICTVQSMVKRVLYGDTVAPAVDAYDCVIIDECHRGSLLDRELSDDELTFRDEADYTPSTAACSSTSTP